MLPLFSLLLVITLSMVVVRVATVALTLTGLSKQSARFQARSAFSGAGFTTSESEKVVGHPVRRQIIMMLMLMGNAGIVTAMSSLVISFGQGETATWADRFMQFSLLLLGILILWWFASSKWIEHWMTRVIKRMLKRFTDLDVRDYASLFHLVGDYQVSEMFVEKGGWLCGQSLMQLGLSREGVIVLGIERGDGRYMGAPRGETELHGGDTILLYGQVDRLKDISHRRPGTEGNIAHVRALKEQAHEVAKQAEMDEVIEVEGAGEGGLDEVVDAATGEEGVAGAGGAELTDDSEPAR